MVFSSLEFIFIFLPIFFGCYYLVPDYMRNYILFLGSMCFYAVGTIGHPEHFFIFIISILVDFTVGILMEEMPEQKKTFLIVGIGFHLLCLGAFKYAGFVLGEVNRLFPSLGIGSGLALPIGISFYTFQGISYLVDVYRGTVRAEKSLLRYSVYISMFEQLIAGPIVTYSQVQKELRHRRIRVSAVWKGIGIFVLGLGMKVLLANPIGKLWTDVQAIGFESISTPLAWMAIIAFSLQIYFDFFGYSLMAIGLGRMLGFQLPKNFSFPYLSRSMTEFWRRWHMTLGGWFREYVYIPLGGNRKGTLTTVRNLLIVWVLTGVWHGAGYNFILWGFVLFAIIALEKFVIGAYLDRFPVLGHLYMMFLIPLTWAIFAIDDIGQLGIFFSRLFPFFGQSMWSIFEYDYLKYWGLYYPFFIAGFLFSTKIPFRMLNKISSSKILSGQGVQVKGIPWRIRKSAVMQSMFAVIFIACVYCMYRGMNDPFLYFRF